MSSIGVGANKGCTGRGSWAGPQTNWQWLGIANTETSATPSKKTSRGRRDARRAIDPLELQVQEARAKVAPLLAAEDRRLTDALEKAEHKVASLSHKDGERSRWFEDHPEVPRRLEAIDSEVSGTEWEAGPGQRGRGA
ncbi:MAG TPA: hypothetical protein VMV14_03015 [Acidimicrobiales bacterium]|nr:hypothetical protein [Acidimicrobiales bacterium]